MLNDVTIAFFHFFCRCKLVQSVFMHYLCLAKGLLHYLWLLKK